MNQTIDLTPRINRKAVYDYAGKFGLVVDDDAGKIFSHIEGRLMALDDLREDFERAKEDLIGKTALHGSAGINLGERLAQLEKMEEIRHKAHALASEDLMRMFGPE